MNLNEYQRAAMMFAKYDTNDYPFIALAEEVGEVMGKIAKFNRKNKSSMDSTIECISGDDFHLNDRELELKMTLKKELGDVLWQLQACCNELGFNLDDVATCNLEKLQCRSSRGVIIGEGDDR